jgi:flagellin
MSVINTNITSMIGQSNLSKSQNALQTSMERLSSGLRINSAKDDAAGQAIANRMTAQITGLSTAQRNANDGISVAQTAEGALNQINDNLQRVRELTVQSANGTNSEKDLTSIQAEIQQRLDEIDRISEQTDFNGTKVLDEGVKEMSIQVGANDNEQITVALETINSEKLGLSSFSVQQNALNVSADPVEYIDVGTGNFAAADVSQAATSLGNLLGKAVNASELTLREVEDSNGAGTGQYAIEYQGEMYAAEQEAASGNANANNFTVAAVNDGTNNVAVKLGVHEADDGTRTVTGYIENANGGYDQVTLSPTATSMTGTDAAGAVSDSSAVYTAGTEFNGAASADPMKTLDAALNKVDSLRSELGAVQNRFESAITNLQTNETNLSAARSRIEDADYATEVANMTRAQILQQAGTSVLAQANQIPQNVLSLLG